jgi:hypothetical protein
LFKVSMHPVSLPPSRRMEERLAASAGAAARAPAHTNTLAAKTRHPCPQRMFGTWKPFRAGVDNPDAPNGQ